MSVLELIDNIIQLIVTFGVGVTACLFAIKDPKFLPFQYFAGGSLCWFIGTIYWTIYFMIYGYFPYYFSASELCYMSFYLFFIGLCILLYKESNAKVLTKKHKLLSTILPLLSITVNTISYALCGGLFWTLYYAIPLTVLAYVASRNISVIEHNFLFNFNLTLVCLVVFNNMMYFVSIFGFNTLYIIFDFLLTLTFPIMLFFLKKERNL